MAERYRLVVKREQVLSLLFNCRLIDQHDMRTSFKLLILLIPAMVHGQQHLPDSITRAYKNASTDSARFVTTFQAYLYFEEINRDTALYYASKALSLARKNNKPLLIARSLTVKGYQ